MEFFQRCSVALGGGSLQSLFATETRGNLTFMSEAKMAKLQKRAEQAEWRKRVQELTEAQAACEAREKEGGQEEQVATDQSRVPIPANSTLPLDISFIVPSVPGPDLPADQAKLCFQGILECQEAGACNPPAKLKVEPRNNGLKQQCPEEAPEMMSSDDEEPINPCPESHRPQQSLLPLEGKEKDGASGHGQGQMLVCVAGPHGSLPVALPKWATPGSLVRVRLGPKTSFRTFVPEGLKEGDSMAIELHNGDRMQVIVPPGKKAGDQVDISPPVLMVQVPNGAKPGDLVEFFSPDGQKRIASIPTVALCGQYFEVPLMQPDFL